MFGNSDFLLDISFPSQEYVPTQDEQAGRLGGSAGADHQPGVVPLTVASCINANKNNAFRNGKCELYNSEFPFCELQGRITKLQTTEDAWEFTFSDGSGDIPMIYQLRNDLDATYEKELAAVRPVTDQDQENREAGALQSPCQVIGVPQILDGVLTIVVAFLRVTTPTDCYACHPLSVVHEFVKWKFESKKVGEEEMGEKSEPSTAAAMPDVGMATDPFGEEDIIIEDADMADLVGPARLNRVIWRLLTESSAVETNGMLLSKVISKCGKWSKAEVDAAITDLEDGGVLIYTTADKSRVSLI